MRVGHRDEGEGSQAGDRVRPECRRSTPAFIGATAHFNPEKHKFKDYAMLMNVSVEPISLQCLPLWKD